MKVPVRARGLVKDITVEFAVGVPASLIAEWNAGLDAESTGLQRDAVEYLESVVAKWEIYERRGRVARSSGELTARTREEQNAEVMGVLIASAEWYQGGAVVGFCEFRRTWSNNFVFDFLGVHPSLLLPTRRQISGLGTALLYALAMLAREMGAGMIWAETTDTSVAFYRRLFDLASLSDLLVLESEEFLASLSSVVEALGKGK